MTIEEQPIHVNQYRIWKAYYDGYFVGEVRYWIYLDMYVFKRCPILARGELKQTDEEKYKDMCKNVVIDEILLGE